MKEYFTIPSVCPICGEKTSIKKDNDSEFLYCLNPDCNGKAINQLDHFCGKKGLDIKGLSEATLSKLKDWGWVNRITDIYKLKDKADEWKKKPGFGEKSVENILAAIEVSKECDLDKYICALGIPLIGSSASKELVKHFSTWDEFYNAIENKFHFWELPNFGPEMSEALLNFNYTEANALQITTIHIRPAKILNESNDKLKDKSIVITGKLSHFKNRDELKSIIEKNGGKVVSSVTKKTSYLINNDVNSTSSKNISAKKLEIPILSEEDFIKTFGI